MKRNHWIAAAVVVLLIVAGVYGYRRMRAADATPAAAQQTAVVERGSFEKTVSSTGNLASGHEVALSFGSSGTVAEVPVALGDEVGGGQLLAVLETGDLELGLASAEASLRSATTSLASARTALADLEDGPDASTAEDAKLQVERAKDQLWGVQSQRDATCGKVGKGKGDQKVEQVQCDSAQASVLGSEISVRSAELAYQKVLAGATESELAAARDKVAQGEAQVQTAKAQADQARLKLEEAKLTAPISGTITALVITPGQMAAAEQSVVTVSDLETLEVVVSVAESDVSDVAVGQSAQVTLDAFPGKQLGAKVTAIAPTAQVQSGVVLFPVTVRLDPTDVPARPGMTVNVDISTVSAENVLVIPSRAVITTDAGTFVMRVSRADGTVADTSQAGGGRFPSAGTPELARTRRTGAATTGGAADTATFGAAERVAVSLGVSDDTQVEVLDGLSEGDVVLVASSSGSTNTFGSRGGGDVFIMGGGGFPGDRP
jgi:HlyD family secretion protein